MSDGDYEGPVQVIAVDTKTSSLIFRKERLAHVLANAPPKMKVAVVSVVGAFRTGKSFLLDLFLRYLRAGAPQDVNDESWLYMGGDSLEGSVEGNAPDFVRVPSSKGAAGGGGGDGEQQQQPQREYTGFKWRPGNDRETLGIWLWNKPFILRLPGSGEEVAVLLMDTQGLFDTLTNASLTAKIFGLSTLISSYQIFNVKDRIGEDVLSHVATFSEYARVAMNMKEGGCEAGAACSGAAGEGGSASRSGGGAGLASAGGGGSSGGGRPGAAQGGGGGLRELDRQAAAGSSAPVFQRLEFLLRDFAGFNTPAMWDDERRAEAEMGSYFRKLFSHDTGERAVEQNKDLRAHRVQILKCFANISCYMLPSPGLKVAVQEPFSGKINDIRDKFRTAVARYARTVFTQQLEAKRMFLDNGDAAEVTVTEFTDFVTACSTVFEQASGDGDLPEIPSLYAATYTVNMRAARDRALDYFREVLQVHASEVALYAEPVHLRETLEARKAHALELFTQKATYGPDVAASKVKLLEELDAMVAQVMELNNAREPKLAEWMLLLGLWLLLAIVQNVLDFTCAPWLSLCVNLSAVASFARMLLVFLIPYAVYFGRIPEFVSTALKELVTFARSHSEALPAFARPFLMGPALGGGAGSASLSRASGSLSTLACSAGIAAASAAVFRATTPNYSDQRQEEMAPPSLSYQSGGVRSIPTQRRKQTRE